MDRYLSVFSPEGHIHQLDYCMKAVHSSDTTVIAVRGGDSVAVVTTRVSKDALIEANSTSRLHRVGKAVFAAFAGRPADCDFIRQRAQYETVHFERDNGYACTVDACARRMGDVAQIFTQYVGNRPPAVAQIYFGIDPELGPQLWRTDPNAFVAGARAAAAGARDKEAESYLEVPFKENIDVKLSADEALALAVGSLRKVCGRDLGPSQIEVGIVRATAPAKLEKLTQEQVEALWNEQSE